MPTGFIPLEDQGYLLIAAQLPDAASLERTQRVLEQISAIALKTPGVEHAITIGGVSALDGNASLANAGVIYLMLNDWGVRYKQQRSGPQVHLPEARTRALPRGSRRVQVVPPPPIQGIGMSGGFQMQVELTDGTYDYRKLQTVTDLLVSEGNTQSGLERVMTTFRADVPQISAEMNRSTAQSLNVPIGNIFDTLQSYLGSTYANQIQKFGRKFTVFVQADSDFVSRRRTCGATTCAAPRQHGADRHAGGHGRHPGAGAHQHVQPLSGRAASMA